MNKRMLGTWVALGAICSAPAWARGDAQSQAGQAQQQKSAPQATGASQTGQRLPVKAEGVIRQQKQVEVRGQDRKHTVVQLETQDRGNLVVDLGSVQAGQQLNKGQRLQVTGYTARVGDRAVLFATNAAVNGRDLQINRAEQERLQQKQALDMQKQRKVSGKVTRHKTVKTPGGGQHAAVLLDTQRGVMVVDLGKAQKTTSNLKKGTKLTATGRPAQVGDRVVFMAEQFSVGGRQFQAQREMRSGMGGSGQGGSGQGGTPAGQESRNPDSGDNEIFGRSYEGGQGSAAGIPGDDMELPESTGGSGDSSKQK